MTKNYPQVEFIVGNPIMDLVALQIIISHDEKLFLKIKNIYPDFSGIDKYNKAKLRKSLKNIYQKNKNVLDNCLQDYENIWRQIETEWFEYLNAIFSIENWQKSNKFRAYVGVCPIYPRDIVKQRFLISCNFNSKELIRICAHETSHFYFYHKICQMHQNVSCDQLIFDKHIWFYSELMVPLLFSSPMSKKILGNMPINTYVCSDNVIKKTIELFYDLDQHVITFDQFYKQLTLITIYEDEINTKFLNNP